MYASPAITSKAARVGEPKAGAAETQRLHRIAAPQVRGSGPVHGSGKGPELARVQRPPRESGENRVGTDRRTEGNVQQAA